MNEKVSSVLAVALVVWVMLLITAVIGAGIYAVLS